MNRRIKDIIFVIVVSFFSITLYETGKYQFLVGLGFIFLVIIVDLLKEIRDK